jgi:hypothetical protein
MRRISAILLLVAFSLPLIAAAFQNSDANLPACCRRAGIHHCGGMGYVDSGSATGPALKSGACPYFPTTASVCAFAKIALPGVTGTLPLLDSKLSAERIRSHVRITTSPDDSHPKRGPPSLLS